MLRRYTTALVLAAVSSAALFSSGCQNSGHASADVDVDRPRMTSTYSRTDTSTAAPAASVSGSVNADYSTAYVANRDTNWVPASDTSATGGMLHRGDVVYFRTAPGPSGNNWVMARTADGRMVMVHPNDFHPQ